MNKSLFQKQLLSMCDSMMRFAFILTTNKDDAEDLFQETFLKVLNNREKFADNKNLKGWVLTVMKHIFINNYNKIIRIHTVVDQDADLYNLDTVNDSGFNSPDSAYRIQEINKAIESLKPEYKKPFSLYVMGYKYNEIAEMLDIPLGTVKSNIFSARQELRRILEDKESID
ncbi:MAG: RNA polymerase sigma factor [Tannerellaceae bacterium]|nr:RNA polymerase sigma factor [Tannerellaceae bacterium]